MTSCMVWKPENRCFRAAPPKIWPFFGQKWPKIANFGKKAVFLDTGAQFKTPLPYIFGCLTRKHICCMVSKPENGRFRAAPTKKWAFSARKRPKNANIGPKTLFFGLGRSVQGPPTLLCRCLTRKNVDCMVWSPETGVSGWPIPKDGHFWAKNDLKLPILGKKRSIFGPGCAVQGPPTPFLRCLTQKNMCCVVLRPENRCLRVAQPKKWAFFAQKRPKNAKIWPKHCFLGLGGRFKAPQPYYAGA